MAGRIRVPLLEEIAAIVRPVRLDPSLTPERGAVVYNASMSFRPPHGNPNAKRGRTPPPEDTFEEAGFLKALGEKQKAVSLKLMDGQIVQGWIEYYDKNMVRLTRQGAPNLFIFKHEIMYIAEDGARKK
jgi:host factor-I protein